MTKGNSKSLLAYSKESLENEDRRREPYFHTEDIDFKRFCDTDIVGSTPEKTTCISTSNSHPKSIGADLTHSITKGSTLSKCIATKEGIGGNAARERTRVHQLKKAFDTLQKALPNVPEGTKLSKLDILLLATNHISHLMSKLSQGYVDEHLKRMNGKELLHPIKKWPMRTRLFVSNQWMESSNQKTVERSNVAKNIQRYEPNQPYLTSYNRFEEENVLPPSYDTTTVNNEKEWYRDEMNKIRCIERNKVTNYSINYLVN